jgi:hypothetical protein
MGIYKAEKPMRPKEMPAFNPVSQGLRHALRPHRMFHPSPFPRTGISREGDLGPSDRTCSHAHSSPGEPGVYLKVFIWSTDLMVQWAKKGGITQLMGNISDYTFVPPANSPFPLAPPKYPSPTYQLDRSTLIESDDTYCENGY